MFFQKPTYQPTVCLLLTTFFFSLSSFLFFGGEKSKVSSSFNTTTLFPSFFALTSPAITLPFFDPAENGSRLWKVALACSRFYFLKSQIAIGGQFAAAEKKSTFFARCYQGKSRVFFWQTQSSENKEVYFLTFFVWKFAVSDRQAIYHLFSKKSAHLANISPPRFTGKASEKHYFTSPSLPPPPLCSKLSLGSVWRWQEKRGGGENTFFLPPHISKIYYRTFRWMMLTPQESPHSTIWENIFFQAKLWGATLKQETYQHFLSQDKFSSVKLNLCPLYFTGK